MPYPHTFTADLPDKEFGEMFESNIKIMMLFMAASEKMGYRLPEWDIPDAYIWNVMIARCLLSHPHSLAVYHLADGIPWPADPEKCTRWRGKIYDWGYEEYVTCRRNLLEGTRTDLPPPTAPLEEQLDFFLEENKGASKKQMAARIFQWLPSVAMGEHEITSGDCIIAYALFGRKGGMISAEQESVTDLSCN